MTSTSPDPSSSVRFRSAGQRSCRASRHCSKLDRHCPRSANCREAEQRYVPKEANMATHETGTREEWLKARLELLEAEKELTRRGDELARRRRELPWVRIDKDYR